jgi:hypothetical protein
MLADWAWSLPVVLSGVAFNFLFIFRTSRLNLKR